MNEDRQEWIDAYFDGTASQEVLQQLDRALVEDEDLRIQFLETANLLAELPLVVCGEEPVSAPLLAPSSVGVRGWQPLALAACAALLLGLAALFSSWRSSVPDVPVADAPSALTLTEGSAQFEGSPLKEGDRFDPPGKLEAKAGATAVFRYPDGSQLTLEDAAGVRLESGAAKKLFLEQGALVVDVVPQLPGVEMIIETANSKVTVLGTRYRLATTDSEDLLQVDYGKVRVLEKVTGLVSTVAGGGSYRVSATSPDQAGPEPSANPAQGVPQFPAKLYGQGEIRLAYGTVKKKYPQPQFPPRAYDFHRPGWIRETFEAALPEGDWEVSASTPQKYQPFHSSKGVAAIQQSTRTGKTTAALKLSRPAGDGPPVRMRLRKVLKWDYFSLKYLYQALGDEPFELSSLCLDLPEGIEEEEVFKQEAPELSPVRGKWNKVEIQYIRFWDGERWRLEVRRYLNGELRTMTRLNIERAPPLLFELKSGAGLFDDIAIGEVFPAEE